MFGREPDALLGRGTQPATRSLVSALASEGGLVPSCTQPGPAPCAPPPVSESHPHNRVSPRRGAAHGPRRRPSRVRGHTRAARYGKRRGTRRGYSLGASLIPLARARRRLACPRDLVAADVAQSRLRCLRKRSCGRGTSTGFPALRRAESAWRWRMPRQQRCRQSSRSANRS